MWNSFLKLPSKLVYKLVQVILINFITTHFLPKLLLYSLFTFTIHHTWLWVAFSYFQKSDSNFKDKDILKIYFSVLYII